MQSLLELQRAFSAAVLFGNTAAISDLGIVAGGVDASTRIGIYRNNLLGNYRKALAATYPVLRRLVGGSRFDTAIDAFVRAHPSAHGDVNRYGGELARFLGAYPPATEFEYLPDVARLEWAIDQASIAADAPSLDLAALAAIPVEAIGTLCFALHPSAQIVASPYPLLHIWRVNQPAYAGDNAVDLGEGGDALLVRRGTDGVSIERLAAGDHAFLAALAGDCSLHEAAERATRAAAAFDLAEVLKRHVVAQTIVAFHTPTTFQSGIRQ